MNAKLKLGVLASHPIQYQAPLFRELASRVDLKVFFAHRQTPEGQAVAGFGTAFEWDVDLLAGYSYDFLRNEARSPDTSRFFGCDSPEIGKLIAKNGFDAFLVLGWNLKSYWQAIRACRRLKVPVMVRGDSQLLTQRSWVTRTLKKVGYPLLLRQFDACLYVGQRNREYLSHYGVPQNKLFFSPHCVDNERFAKSSHPCDRPALRRSLGFAPDERIVLFVGKLVDVKRPADFVQALALLQKQGPRIAGLVVGDGPLREELVRRADASGAHVQFAGFWNQAQLPQAYAVADVLVLPSKSETWGLVVNEALACGTPVVVACSVGCGPDLVRPGVTGQIFATGNTAALADALGRVLLSPLQREAIARVIAQYSPEAAANGILEAVNAASKEATRHG